MHKIISFHKHLSNLGTTSENNKINDKQTQLINIFSLIIIYAGVIFSIHDYVLDIPIDSTIGHVITFIVMSIVLFLNSKQKQLWSKTIWSVYFLLSLVVFSSWVEPGTYTEYFILLFPAATLCVYSNRYIALVLLPICFFLFCIPYYIIPAYPSNVIEKKQIFVEFILMIATFLLVTYFKNINEKNERLLQISNDTILNDKIILEKQQRELQELNKLKSHFFVNLSHEIRTPITLIKGYREQLQIKNHINDSYLKVIDEQIYELHKITDTIIDLSKMDENKFSLLEKHYSLHLFLNKTQTNFKSIFEQKNITLKNHLLEEDLHVLFDIDLMTRCLNNLMSNALKFTNTGGTVSIKSYTNQDSLFIEVIDDGIGIPDKELTTIFNRYYQSDNHITKSQGSGIGLHFTQKIITQHNFSIFAKNNQDKGSCFTIAIPKHKTKKASLLSTEEVIPNNKVYAKKTILLVDDHAQMRSFLKKILNNFDIIEAENGQEALHILETTKIDLLLTDYMMPVMDGFELVKKVKKNQYTLPVIIITARVDLKGKIDMLRLGIDNYFTKPFHNNELTQAIYKSLDYNDVMETQKSNPKNNNASLTTTEQQKFDKKFQKHIEKNISNFNFGVEDIALHFKISSKTLTRKTKLYFGQTPNQLIREARLLKAKKILDSKSDITLNDIANQVGIKNTSYLKKRFKERF